MENRLRKLINEEERLQKQIEIANKHTVLADEVQDRMKMEARHKEMFKKMNDEAVQRIAGLNIRRKEENKKNIKEHQNIIQKSNLELGNQ